MTRMKILLSALVAFVLTGCPNPNPVTPKDKYAAGYSTVKYGKFVVQTAYTGFKGFASIKCNECNDKVCSKLHPDKTSEAYKTCMSQDHSAVAEFKACYGKLGQAEVVIDKAYPLTLSVLQDVKEILDLVVQYEVAKESVKLGKDPEALKKFCAAVYPAKTGDEYDKCLKGEQLAKFDYMAVLKGRACTAYHALDFVPSPYNKYTDPVRMWFKGYGDGCKQ
jgi:hypothetical protein